MLLDGLAHDGLGLGRLKRFVLAGQAVESLPTALGLSMLSKNATPAMAAVVTRAVPILNVARPINSLNLPNRHFYQLDGNGATRTRGGSGVLLVIMK